MIAEKEATKMNEERQGKREWKNEMEVVFDGIAQNESFARVTVAAFVAPLNPTLEEMSDIKTAISEAVTNAIIHGYENDFGYGKRGANVPCGTVVHEGKVWLRCKIENGVFFVEVEDKGKGIGDIEKAMEPLFTTRPEWNRSGMGFSFMEAFMDDLEVESAPGKGTKVRMCKKISAGSWIGTEE